MDFSNFWWQASVDAPPPIDIGNSLRFRGAQSLTGHTGGSGTASVWIKRGKLGTAQTVMSGIAFAANDTLNGSTAVFRDPGAWMHVVVSSSGTYVNGVSVAAGSAISAGTIGASCEFYLAGFYFVDGQALGPTAFGQYDANGIWGPPADGIANYGANGFHLDFSDPADIGADRSGNGNDFTATGFELGDQTSANWDHMLDCPATNFVTGNPLAPGVDFYWANLYFGNGRDLQRTQPSTLAVPRGSGRVYCEFIQGGTGEAAFGLSDFTRHQNIDPDAGPNTAADWAYYCERGANPRYIHNETEIASDTSFGNGDYVGIFYDSDTGEIYYSVNGAMTQSGAAIPYASAPQVPVVPATGTLKDAIGRAGARFLNAGQQPWRFDPNATWTGGGAGWKHWNSAAISVAPIPNTITGTFTGNNSVDGPFVYTGCVPGRIQYGSVDVLYQDRLAQTNVDFLSNGFKVRSTTSNSGTVNYTVTTTHTGGEYNGRKIPFSAPATAISN